METVIPFLPFPLESAKRRTRWLLGLGGKFEKSVPGLKMQLFQADLDISPREWTAIALFGGAMYFVMFTVILWIINLIFSHPAGDFVALMAAINQIPQTTSLQMLLDSFGAGLAPLLKVGDLVLPLAVGAAFGGFVYMYLLRWPSLLVSRHVKDLERQMLAALHHMLIEVKSGVPLFNALVAVSEGYGEISHEFRRIVNDINAGTSENEALDAASRRNTSLHFRRALWQIVDALRSGSSIGAALDAVVGNLVNEQMIAVHKYGQELNPYIMIYMLIAVIMPSLGITFLIILSSFSGMNIPKIIFPAILFGLVMFQFFYMGMIRVRRPVGVL